RLGAVVHAAQTVRRLARRQSLRSERKSPRHRGPTRRLGRCNRREPFGRTVSAHAWLRTRRHERSARRTVCSHGQRKVSETLATLSSQSRPRTIGATRRSFAGTARKHADPEADRTRAPLRTYWRRVG